MVDLTIQPECRQWRSACSTPAEGDLLGTPLSTWCRSVRQELGLPTDRPVIATGHQSLLWHPGILVKYLLTDAVASMHGLAMANLVVDQHAGGYATFPIPIRRSDDTLALRTIALTSAPAGVPMALHDSFIPADPPPRLREATPSVRTGVDRIFTATRAHHDQPNAALQMAHALADLMRPWVKPMTHITASDLIETSLSRALMLEMVRDPHTCARKYNDAVRSVPEAGIGPLLIRDDYIELPFWRIRPDGQRMRAYDHDVEQWLHQPCSAPRLMPRALSMTALLRLGMCDLFVHGAGGAVYDVAMERWIESWLGVKTAPKAIATATLRLPLTEPGEIEVDLIHARAQARRAWHNPEPTDPRPPRNGLPAIGEVKNELLAAIEQAPRGSYRRRLAFFAMHEQLATLRSMHIGYVERLQRALQKAERQAKDRAVSDRRDWAFPLYPDSMIAELARAVQDAVGVGCC